MNRKSILILLPMAFLLTGCERTDTLWVKPLLLVLLVPLASMLFKSQLKKYESIEESSNEALRAYQKSIKNDPSENTSRTPMSVEELISQSRLIGHYARKDNSLFFLSIVGGFFFLFGIFVANSDETFMLLFVILGLAMVAIGIFVDYRRKRQPDYTKVYSLYNTCLICYDKNGNQEFLIRLDQVKRIDFEYKTVEGRYGQKNLENTWLIISMLDGETQYRIEITSLKNKETSQKFIDEFTEHLQS